MTLQDMAASVFSGDGTARAIEFEGRWLDWNWIKETVRVLDKAFDVAGVRPDDRIGFAPRNRPECAAALLGLIASGRDVVMLYAYQSPEALARRMTELRLPVVVATTEAWSEATIEAMRQVGGVGICLGANVVVSVAGTRLDRSAVFEHAPAEPGIALLTSGTTGSPKHFHMSYPVIKRAMIDESWVRTEEEALGKRPIAILYYPFGNISGVYGYLPLAFARQPVRILEKFSLEEWVRYIKEARPVMASVPVVAFRMMLEARLPREDLASLSFISTGAATLDPGVHVEFEETYGLTVLQAYGATEFGGVVASVTPADIAAFGKAKVHSVGRAMSPSRVRVVDQETGAEAPVGQVGVLEVLSPRMGPDWIRTTDLGELDEDGFLYHRGRSDGAIMRGGFKILPEGVAAVLASHPAIATAVVVGVADPRLGEAPVAVYELRAESPSPTPEDLDAFLRDRLPATHIPTQYRCVVAIPRTPSLKPNIAAIRTLFQKPTTDGTL